MQATASSISFLNSVFFYLNMCFSRDMKKLRKNADDMESLYADKVWCTATFIYENLFPK